MKLYLKILASFLLVYSVISAAQRPSIVKKPPQIYSEDNLNIMVNPMQSEFIIQIKSNPTTGFSWFLREYNSELITPVKQEFIAPNSKSMGAPGMERWTFRMKPNAFIVPQQTTIRMIYSRPFQGSDNSTQIVFRVSSLTK